MQQTKYWYIDIISDFITKNRLKFVTNLRTNFDKIFSLNSNPFKSTSVILSCIHSDIRQRSDQIDQKIFARNLLHLHKDELNCDLNEIQGCSKNIYKNSSRR